MFFMPVQKNFCKAVIYAGNSKKRSTTLPVAGHPIRAGISTSATTVGINSRHTTSRFSGQAMPQQALSQMSVSETGTMGG
jgi:hypothetical protein